MGLKAEFIQKITHGDSANDIINNNKHFGADQTSFSERQKVERNRQVIKGYRNSKVYQDPLLEKRIAETTSPTPFQRAEAESTPVVGGRNSDPGFHRADSARQTAPVGYQSSLAARQAMADRFSGGVARPAPKTGGAARPMSKPGGFGLGRH